MPPAPTDVRCELEKVGHTADFRAHIGALIRGRDEVVIGKNGWAHLHELARDPGEQHPQSWDTGRRVVLQEALDLRLTDGGSEIEPATREKPRALGYAF